MTTNLALPDAVYCSPANRARETLAPLLAERPDLDSEVRFVPQIYSASTNTLQTLIDHAFAEADHVLLVGHNPGLEQLLFSVLSDSEKQRIDRLASGTLAVIEFAGGWPDDAGCGKLRHAVRGKHLVEGQASDLT